MPSYRRLIHLALLAGFAALQHPPLGHAQTVKGPVPLTLEDVVELHTAGFSEEIIITKIKKSGKAFDLSAGELTELKKSGISENVLKYLIDPSVPYAAPVPASPPGGSIPGAAARKFPPDPHSAEVPPEPGLYRFEHETPIKIDLKVLLGVKTSTGLVMLKKEKVTAYLVGPASKTRLSASSAIFYLRLPEGKMIEDIVLAAMIRGKDRRALETGPPAPKQELKAEAMKQFDALEVGPQLFKITPQSLLPGEYLFFQIGSAEPPKGSYGKGFDFAIESNSEPKQKKK